jgi:hypothetical protein
MLLFGPEMGRFEVLGEDHARRLEAPPAAGVGAVGDERADNGQYIERRVDGGPWVAWSYFAGAADFWFRARLMAIEQLENDERRLRERAQGIANAAGADVQGARNAIANAEAALKAALAAEKEQRAIAHDLQKQAGKVEAQLAPLRRELEGTPPVPADELEAAKT